MKTILECTPKGQTLYEMPEAIYIGVSRVLENRLAKSVKQALTYLPEHLRNSVTKKEIPFEPPKTGVHGLIFYEEARLTREEVELLSAVKA